MRALVYTIWYQLLIFFRLKEALFFMWMFPLLLFSVFGSLWSLGSPDYIAFLLTGVMGMVITNEGFYSIGGVVRDYYSNGLIKYLAKLPTNISVFFLGYLFSRFVSIAIISSLISILAFILFGFKISVDSFSFLLVGSFCGILTLGALGLCISFSGIKKNSTTPVMNIIGYFMLFTSDTFYPVSQINENIALLGKWLPLNCILELMRTGSTNWWLLLAYLLTPSIIFIYLFKRHQYSR